MSHREFAAVFVLVLVAAGTFAGCQDTDAAPVDVVCGGELGETCDADMYCAYEPPADCGRADATALCKARPEVCPEIYAPVCGCDGNTYASACDAAAHGVGYDRTGACGSDAQCGGPGECVALVPGCCGVCGAPSLDDVVGVNVDEQDSFREATCDDPSPECPKCAQMPEPNLVALCNDERCVPLDIRTDAFSSCETDADCVLRDPDCCESCAPEPYELVAIAAGEAGRYRAAACRAEQSCPPCVPTCPPDVGAACGSDGHCRVERRTPA